MFAQAVLASQALRQAMPGTACKLTLALSGCRLCRTVRIIATPVLGRCDDCDVPLVSLSDAHPQALQTPKAALGRAA